ncbi:MAG: ferredoxin [Phycisphaeraceae bacterium]|nr:ferredoxin [Phycisphaeraceae bacterium]
MAHVITSACEGCKHIACVSVCPMDCIHPTSDEEGFESAKQLYVNPDTCIDCGLCEAECPVKAIFQEEDLPPDMAHFAQVNSAWFAGEGSEPEEAPPLQGGVGGVSD